MKSNNYNIEETDIELRNKLNYVFMCIDQIIEGYYDVDDIKNDKTIFEKGISKEVETELVNINKIIMNIFNLVEERAISENILLEAKVEERTAQLKALQLEIIQRLGLAAEYKDLETWEHNVRIGKITFLITEKYGLTNHECNLYEIASQMHDLGKVGIPDKILLKPGKLDEAEWKIMKTHTTIGANLLSKSNSNLINLAELCALTHHEKWNGLGYPNGIAKRNIPLIGRITAIADVYDALISVRPYKKAWKIKDAVNLIESEKGKHFDPDLIDIFIENLNNIKEFYN